MDGLAGSSWKLTPREWQSTRSDRLSNPVTLEHRRDVPESIPGSLKGPSGYGRQRATSQRTTTLAGDPHCLPTLGAGPVRAEMVGGNGAPDIHCRQQRFGSSSKASSADIRLKPLLRIAIQAFVAVSNASVRLSVARSGLPVLAATGESRTRRRGAAASDSKFSPARIARARSALPAVRCGCATALVWLPMVA